jgi:N-acetylglucosaminyl-diphospho-decaprenol L-rhamnosyltransferase
MMAARIAGNPRLTVLVITWNGWGDTRRCLESVQASSEPDMDVVVFDNASTDGTPDEIARNFPDVRVIRSAVNVGHTVGFNRSMAAIQGEYVLVLDSDTELAADTIPQILEFLADRGDVGLVAPRTLNSDGSVQQSARSFPRPMNGLFGRQSFLTRTFPRNPLSRRYLLSDKLSTNEPYEVEQISSACMLFRRELFDSIGPWDEGYPGYWVDTDWCFRAGGSGWKVYCVPRALVIHHEQNRRGRKKSPRRIWMFHYGAYRFYRKSMTWGVGDPRALLAAIALTAHGLLQLAQNMTLPAETPKQCHSPHEAQKAGARASDDADSLC